MVRLLAGLGLAFDIVVGSFRLLRMYPVLIVPLLPVFLMVLGVEFGILLINELYLQLALIFIVAYALMFSFVFSSNMLHQIHEGQKPSLLEAISSPSSMRLIPKVFLLSVVWFAIIMVLVAIQMALERFTDRDSGSGGIVSGIFGTLGDALRMMGFMMIPIMVFENAGLSQGFGRLKSTLRDSPITALSGLALTKTATTLIFLIIIGLEKVLGPISLLGFLIVLVFIGVGWTLSLYLEQLFAAGLYMYSAFPESKVVEVLLKKHLGQELPRVPIPEIAEQPTTT